jgi:hypothetical protein
VTQALEARQQVAWVFEIDVCLPEYLRRAPEEFAARELLDLGRHIARRMVEVLPAHPTSRQSGSWGRVTRPRPCTPSESAGSTVTSRGTSKRRPWSSSWRGRSPRCSLGNDHPGTKTRSTSSIPGARKSLAPAPHLQRRRPEPTTIPAVLERLPGGPSIASRWISVTSSRKSTPRCNGVGECPLTALLAPPYGLRRRRWGSL